MNGNPSTQNRLQQTMQKTFGYETFKPGQWQVMEKIVGGQSAVAIFPTGAGKSLCYQLPALQEEGLTLVVSPLLALMKEQIGFLQRKHIAAAKLDYAMGSDAYDQTLQKAGKGELDILMISVERFKNERFRTRLKKINISFLAVDEAHCISEWGHNFRPDYLKIAFYQKEFKIPKTLLLTATATPKVVDDMCRKFCIAEKNVVRTGFFRENLAMRVVPTEEKHKDDALVRILDQKPAGPAIVYVTHQKTAEALAAKLSKGGLAAEAYHAGMANDLREAVQNRFMASGDGIVVATIAFGMGIDKENIRNIVHYDLPKSIEGYSQEIGRAGRDGQPALCCLLANRNGVPALENFVYGDTPHAAGIRQVLTHIRQSDSTQYEFRPYSLSRDTDIRILPLKTLMVYLELAGIVSPRYTYFEEYPFRYITTAEKIAVHFKGERQKFVETILKHARTARTWTYPDMEAIQEETGSDRQRILTALEYFHEKGWILLQPKSAVEIFEICEPGFDIAEITESLIARFKKKEALEIARIHDMIALFEKNQCLASSLSAHFGEKLTEPCGRCSTCTEKRPPVFPPSDAPHMDGYNCISLLGPLTEKISSPLPVHLAARFLCGISSPAMVPVNAKTMPGFGALKDQSYKKVEQWVADCQ